MGFFCSFFVIFFFNIFLLEYEISGCYLMVLFNLFLLVVDLAWVAVGTSAVAVGLVLLFVVDIFVVANLAYTFSSSRPCLKNINTGVDVPSMSRYSQIATIPSMSIDSPVKNCKSLNRPKISFMCLLILVLNISTWSGASFSNLAINLQQWTKNEKQSWLIFLCLGL